MNPGPHGLGCEAARGSPHLISSSTQKMLVYAWSRDGASISEQPHSDVALDLVAQQFSRRLTAPTESVCSGRSCLFSAVWVRVPLVVRV